MPDDGIFQSYIMPDGSRFVRLKPEAQEKALEAVRRADWRVMLPAEENAEDRARECRDGSTDA